MKVELDENSVIKESLITARQQEWVGESITLLMRGCCVLGELFAPHVVCVLSLQIWPFTVLIT